MREPLKGIELCPTCNVVEPDGRRQGPIPEKASVFEWLFRPILHDLRAYHWGIDDLWGILVGVPEEMSRALDDLSRGQYTPGWALFPEAAQFVVNDWCDFHAVTDARVPLDQFIKAVNSGWAGVSEVSDVTFYCVDGARWMFFARDASLLETMRAHHRAVLKPRGIGLREKVDDTLD